ncbi:MAG: DUF2806 domain-containing protein [Chloroflexi bacterium]|nr:DUF2806 domain-containing protein [Chloroflexota bacterium]
MLDLIKPKKLVIKGKAANALFPMIVGLNPDLYLRGMRAIAEGEQVKLGHGTPGSDIVPRVERLERAAEKVRLANITTLAAERLEADADPSRLNANWRERFVSHASKIADEDMHEAWSRLLAGEINAPGTFSIRAIATVADMQYHDARNFAELSQFTWRIGDERLGRRVLVEVPFGSPESPMDRGINYHTIMDLEAFGLVRSEFYKTGSRIGGTVVFTHVGDPGCTASLKAEDYYDIPLGGVSFTTIGRELSQIVDIGKPPPEYVEACFRLWARFSEHRRYRVVELTGGPSLSSLAETDNDIRLIYGSDFDGEKRDLLMDPVLHAAAPLEGPLFQCAVCDRPAQTFRLDDDATKLVACDVCGLVWGVDSARAACPATDAGFIKAEVQKRLERCGAQIGERLSKDSRDALRGVPVFVVTGEEGQST